MIMFGRQTSTIKMATRGTPEAFINVCDRELDIEDFLDVYEAVKPFSANSRQIGIYLGLRTYTMNTIKENSDKSVITCLEQVLQYWLSKGYNYERHGVPCWRKVCTAIKKGGDPALAEKIAQEHPLVPATPNPSPTTKRARHSLPVITGGDTPYYPPAKKRASLPVTTDSIPATTTGGASSIASSIPIPSIYVPMTISDFEVIRQISELQEQFAEALQKTKESFKKASARGLLSDSIDYITTHISILLGLRENTPAAVQAVRKEFNDIKNMKALFAILQDKYTSWFNYKIIMKLAQRFQDNYSIQVVHHWNHYEDLLNQYFSQCIKVVNAASFGITNVPPNKKILIAKVVRDDYNQNDLHFLRKAIPPKLDKPDLKLYFCEVLHY